MGHLLCDNGELANLEGNAGDNLTEGDVSEEARVELHGKIGQVHLTGEESSGGGEDRVEDNPAILHVGMIHEGQSLDVVPVEVGQEDVVGVVWRGNAPLAELPDASTGIEKADIPLAVPNLHAGGVPAHRAEYGGRQGSQKTLAGVKGHDVPRRDALDNRLYLCLNLLACKGSRHRTSHPPKTYVHNLPLLSPDGLVAVVAPQGLLHLGARV